MQPRVKHEQRRAEPEPELEPEPEPEVAPTRAGLALSGALALLADAEVVASRLSTSLPAQVQETIGATASFEAPWAAYCQQVDNMNDRVFALTESALAAAKGDISDAMAGRQRNRLCPLNYCTIFHHIFLSG